MLKEDLIEKEKNINFAIKNILEEKKKKLSAAAWQQVR